MKYLVEMSLWNRWIIVHPQDRHLAWSGSCWVPHVRGVGTLAQISNYETRDAAHAAARQQIA